MAIHARPPTNSVGTSTANVSTVDIGTDAEVATVIVTESVEVQTDTTLPHTMRNIMWSAEGLDPIVDCDDSDSVDDESIATGIMEGTMVDDIDLLVDDHPPS